MKTLFTLLFAGMAAIACAQDGPVQERYDNGKLRSTRYTDGEVVRFVTYYESGRVKEMGSFREGLTDGTWRQFAENGTVLCEARFVAGQRQGEWTFRNTADASVGRVRYTDNAPAYAEQRSGSGELIAARIY